MASFGHYGQVQPLIGQFWASFARNHEKTAKKSSFSGISGKSLLVLPWILAKILENGRFFDPFWTLKMTHFGCHFQNSQNLCIYRARRKRGHGYPKSGAIKWSKMSLFGSQNHEKSSKIHLLRPSGYLGLAQINPGDGCGVCPYPKNRFFMIFVKNHEKSTKANRAW